MTRSSAFQAIALATLLLLSRCSGATHSAGAPLVGGEWREFEGTWIAAGTRNTLRLGDDRASVADYSGSLVLTGPSRPAVGFRAEAVIFNDYRSGLVGRAVWTDDRGNQVFSDLRSTSGAPDSKIVGTFTGGTGRFSGATGNYQFSWRFLVETEGGNVQGQSMGLSGRIRASGDDAAANGASPQP